VIASSRATFSTPFVKLGLPPEGCSPLTFPAKMGAAGAKVMLALVLLVLLLLVVLMLVLCCCCCLLTFSLR